MPDFTVRQARPADVDAVRSFTTDTWADRPMRDYVPDVFAEWVDADGPDQRTVVLEADGDVVGCCQGTMLSAHEGWAQGMRVDPAFRGAGASPALSQAIFDWAADRGATVVRNLVFSWNDAGLGHSRSVGFEPVTEFRFVHPEPADDAAAETDEAASLTVDDDPAAAWSCWQRSDGADALAGLALDPTETWALSELTRSKLFALADDERVFAVRGQDGTRAAACRVRTVDRETAAGPECDDEFATERYAEYGFAVWADVDAARTLVAAIRRDAADVGADVVRVAIPETPRYVSDAALLRADVGDTPEFVLEADVTGRDEA